MMAVNPRAGHVGSADEPSAIGGPDVLTSLREIPGLGNLQQHLQAQDRP